MPAHPCVFVSIDIDIKVKTHYCKPGKLQIPLIVILLRADTEEVTTPHAIKALIKVHS